MLHGYLGSVYHHQGGGDHNQGLNVEAMCMVHFGVPTKVEHCAAPQFGQQSWKDLAWCYHKRRGQGTLQEHLTLTDRASDTAPCRFLGAGKLDWRVAHSEFKQIPLEFEAVLCENQYVLLASVP